MVCSIEKHWPYLTLLAGDSKINPRLKAALVCYGPDSLLCLICACCLNLLKRSIPITDDNVQQLRRYKSLIYQLADTNQSALGKRKLMLKNLNKTDHLLRILLPAIVQGVDSGKLIEKNQNE